MMQTIDRILVPVDLSPCSRAAFEQAAFFARHFDASVDIVLVATENGRAQEWSELLDELGGPDGSSDDLQSRAAKALERFLGTFDASGLRLRTRVEVGDPFEVIVRIMTTGAYDLVIIGSHGRDRLLRRVLRGLSERVTQRSRCPVVVVHEDARAPSRDDARVEPVVPARE